MKRQLSRVRDTSQQLNQPDGSPTVVGRIVRVDDSGRVWVWVATGRDARPQAARVSRSIVASNVSAADLPGREVVLASDANGKPVVVDLIEDGLGQKTGRNPAALEEVIDVNRLQLRAKEQIVFSCGKATITLTRAGKIIIRGAYVTTNSSGVNRIRGGSVQIN